MAEPVKIKVHFDFEGKEYEGFLTAIVGPGSGPGPNKMFELNTPGKYWGVLFYQDHAIEDYGVKDGWKFHSSGKTDLDCLAEPLGNIVEIWYE